MARGGGREGETINTHDVIIASNVVVMSVAIIHCMIDVSIVIVGTNVIILLLCIVIFRMGLFMGILLLVPLLLLVLLLLWLDCVLGLLFVWSFCISVVSLIFGIMINHSCSFVIVIIKGVLVL